MIVIMSDGDDGNDGDDGDDGDEDDDMTKMTNDDDCNDYGGDSDAASNPDYVHGFRTHGHCNS